VPLALHDSQTPSRRRSSSTFKFEFSHCQCQWHRFPLHWHWQCPVPLAVAHTLALWHTLTGRLAKAMVTTTGLPLAVPGQCNIMMCQCVALVLAPQCQCVAVVGHWQSHG